MITLAFLIVISPLVTITYSIDKMGDGRSQALNVWFKEYVYNILIQPFHCISYRVLAQTSIDLLVRDGWAEGAGLSNAVVAIMTMLFIFTAEDIVKHIFHFESQSMGKTVANAAIGGMILNKVMSGGKKSKGGSGGGRFGFGSKNGGNNSNQNNNARNNRNAGNNGNNGNTGNNVNTGGTGQNQNRSGNNSGGNSSNGNQNNNSGNTNIPVASSTGESSSRKGKGKGRVGAVLRGAGRAYIGANARIAGAMLFGGLGLGLGGDTKTGFAGVTAGWCMGRSFSKANDTRILKHKLAKAVNKYKNENPNLTSEELYKNALHFADGSLTPQTETEIELAKQMQKMEQKFIDNGIDEKKIPKQFNKLISDIEDGNISEYSTFQRFTGSIKNKIPKGNGRRRRRNNYNYNNSNNNDSTSGNDTGNNNGNII